MSVSISDDFSRAHILLCKENNKPVPTYEKYLSAAVVVITGIVTVLAWMYIAREIERVKPHVIYERRKAR